VTRSNLNMYLIVEYFLHISRKYLENGNVLVVYFFEFIVYEKCILIHM
jgi:hypothetical protein